MGLRRNSSDSINNKLLSLQSTVRGIILANWNQTEERTSLEDMKGKSNCKYIP